jgi:hypothetical protein
MPDDKSKVGETDQSRLAADEHHGVGHLAETPAEAKKPIDDRDKNLRRGWGAETWLDRMTMVVQQKRSKEESDHQMIEKARVTLMAGLETLRRGTLTDKEAEL